MTREKIIEECKKHDITNYKINDDGSIDVDGFVIIVNTELTSLPIRFNIVSDDFYCGSNKLTTLEGCPKEVGGSFYCSDNDLTSLEYSPIHVGGSFLCNKQNNLLKILSYLNK